MTQHRKATVFEALPYSEYLEYIICNLPCSASRDGEIRSPLSPVFPVCRALSIEVFSQPPCEVGTVVISILQVRKRTHREVRWFAQDHTAKQVPELNLKASSLLPVFIACAF